MPQRLCFLCSIVASLLLLRGCSTTELAESVHRQPPAAPGVVTLDDSQQQRLGIILSAVRSQVIGVTQSGVGWLEVPPNAQSVIRAPIDGFIVDAIDQRWPELGQTVSQQGVLAQVNVFLTPQEISQLVIAKEDNDVQMEQALVTMELSQSQLNKVGTTPGAVSGVRINELKQALEHAKVAFKEAKDKLPFLIQEPYDNRVLVRPVKIEAPQAGRLLQVHVVPGQFVQSGDPLWTVADWSTLWLRVPVFENQVSQIDRTRAATIHDRSSDAPLAAQPLEIPLETKPLVRTVDLYYRIDNPGWNLRVGQSLRVELPTGSEQAALLVSRSAVLYNGFGQATCFVARHDRTQFERVRIELGKAQGDDIVVTRGLQANDVVVSTGAEQIAAEESHAELAVEDDD